MGMYKSGTFLFAAPYCEEMVIEAKKYVEKNGFTTEDVRIYRPAWTEECGDNVVVVAKRDIPWDNE